MMMQPKGDPFFEQLKADIREALEEADQGLGVDADVVWAEMDALIDEIERRKAADGSGDA